jgi:hypothetical protein
MVENMYKAPRVRVQAAFVTLETSTGHNLTLTPDHYIFAAAKAAPNSESNSNTQSFATRAQIVRASDVQVGPKLLSTAFRDVHSSVFGLGRKSVGLGTDLLDRRVPVHHDH